MNNQKNNEIFAKGDKAPNTFFSNTAWVKMLLTDEKKVYDTQVYNVTFEPKARQQLKRGNL